MRRYLFIACLASALLACGGDESDTTTASQPATGAGDESTTDPGTAPAGEEPSADTEPEPEPEGLPCLPVARCRSFANQDCASIDAEGNVEDEALSAGRVSEACPGERGVSEAIGACFEYVRLDEGCGRSLPDLREPAWPCGRNEDGTCGVQM